MNQSGIVRLVYREGVELMPNFALEPHMQVCRIGDVLDDDMDGELIMMDIERGSYFGLNKTATHIWTLLEHPVVIRDLCDQLTAEFNVPDDRCEEDVLYFLKNLLDRDLLQVITDGKS